VLFLFFFFQAEDGIRDGHVTGVQTCALPIFKEAGDPIVLVGTTRAELGGSEYLRLRKAGGGAVPTVDPSSLRVSLDHLRSAIERSEERRVGKEGRSRRGADR